ncbi:hypothetical protein SISNIDRAFT_488413 [Sistotremastrum niveocremeum HHB9708]|uniref:DASH complex subunit DAD1 n=1 Tax=Sistotremastrum niveocremeum HHB9708 TaxID=1314777 RepID=A0A164RGN2_9AGAM|nr:hypothetical protein SISNIDRAFT_488413 [Sistotremastrum niveocremeum HHB9708]
MTETSFFDKERERLAQEVSSVFEDLLASSNLLNRKLEEVVGMRKEFRTIADLWSSFQQLMRDTVPTNTDDSAGLPGTSGHVLQ